MRAGHPSWSFSNQSASTLEHHKPSHNLQTQAEYHFLLPYQSITINQAMPSETDPLLAEKKEPELTQGGGVHSRQPPATPGDGTAPPSSGPRTPEYDTAESGQNENVGNENSTGNDRGEGSPGTGGGSGQGTTNEATEGDSIAYKVQTFFAVAVAALLTFLKNYQKKFIALLKAYWKSKWFNITLVLISSVYTLIAPKMIERKHPWFCSGGGMLAPDGNLNWTLSHSLIAAAAIKIAWAFQDTNETVHKIYDSFVTKDELASSLSTLATKAEFDRKITEERLTAIDKIDGMAKGQKEMKKELKEMKESQERIEKEQKEMKESQERIEKKQEEMKESHDRTHAMLERILEMMEETHGKDKVAKIIDDLGSGSGTGNGDGAETESDSGPDEVPADDENEEKSSAGAISSSRAN